MLIARPLIRAPSVQRFSVASKRRGFGSITILARQKPGSANGVMFIKVEDETGVANLILWPDRLENQRQVVPSAGMITCQGKVQREGHVIHVVTDRLEDLSDLLRSVGDRDEAFPLTHGRGDGATHPGAPDKRDGPGAGPRRPAN